MILTSQLLDAFELKFGDGIWVSKGGSEINVRCPYCVSRGMGPDRSGHLGLNPEKNVAHCFRCGWGSKNLQSWLEKGGFELASQLRFGQAADVPTLKNRAHKLSYSVNVEPIMVIQEVSLPDHVIPLLECDNPEYATSLLNKGLTIQELDGLYACVESFYKGYVIFPFIETGDLVFWQGRDIWSRKLRKINPPVSDKLPLGKGAWLYGYDTAIGKKGGTCWLCEGALDQISINRWICETQTGDLNNGHYAWGLQGCTLSFPDKGQHPLNSQFGKLAALSPQRVNVVLDDDAYDKAKGLADMLQRCGFDARPIRMTGGDPNELITGEDGIRKFTEIVEGENLPTISIESLSKRLKAIRRN